jgi:hypothetical protein
MTVVIPWPDGAAWQQSVVLSGRVYRMAARWNEIAEAWFLDLSDGDGIPLANGLKMTGGAMITARLADPRLPPGYFAVVFPGGDTPGRDDMQGRARLTYVAL